MPRRMLLALIAGLFVLGATACTDITAPKKECPVTSGGDGCGPH